MGRPLGSTNLSAPEALEQYPPIVVRLLARRIWTGKQVLALSHVEVAIASGIPLERILEISNLFSWDSVTTIERTQFCHACGFDPLNARDRKRQDAYARICLTKYPNRPPHYLRCSPSWTTEFQPLQERLKSRGASSVEFARSA